MGFSQKSSVLSSKEVLSLAVSTSILHNCNFAILNLVWLEKQTQPRKALNFVIIVIIYADATLYKKTQKYITCLMKFDELFLFLNVTIFPYFCICDFIERSVNFCYLISSFLFLSCFLVGQGGSTRKYMCLSIPKHSHLIGFFLRKK